MHYVKSIDKKLKFVRVCESERERAGRQFSICLPVNTFLFAVYDHLHPHLMNGYNKKQSNYQKYNMNPTLIKCKSASNTN